MTMMSAQNAGQGGAEGQMMAARRQAGGNDGEMPGQGMAEGVGEGGRMATSDGCSLHLSGRNQTGAVVPGMAASPVKPGLLPPLGTVVQAGAFGAVLGGATTGLVNTMRAHSGEISREEAVRETVQMAAQGAASMAIASVAAHAVRVHPTFGLVALIGVGVAALTMSRQKRKPARKLA